MHDPMNTFSTMHILGMCGQRDDNGEHVDVAERAPDALDCRERLAAQNDPGTSSRSQKSKDEIATEAGCRCRSVNGSFISQV